MKGRFRPGSKPGTDENAGGEGEFFRELDADVDRVRAHVESELASLERIVQRLDADVADAARRGLPDLAAQSTRPRPKLQRVHLTCTARCRAPRFAFTKVLDPLKTFAPLFSMPLADPSPFAFGGLAAKETPGKPRSIGPQGGRS